MQATDRQAEGNDDDDDDRGAPAANHPAPVIVGGSGSLAAGCDKLQCSTEQGILLLLLLRLLSKHSLPLFSKMSENAEGD